MPFGLRTLLLVAAVILFIVAALSNENYADLIAYGLACTAGAALVSETGWGTRVWRRR